MLYIIYAYIHYIINVISLTVNLLMRNAITPLILLKNLKIVINKLNILNMFYKYILIVFITNFD